MAIFISNAGLSPGMIVENGDFKGKLIWIKGTVHIHDRFYLYEYWQVKIIDSGEIVYKWIKGGKRK